MAGVHGLQHVERLSGADLAHDDPVRAHAQRVADQVALGDARPSPSMFEGRVSQTHDMWLLELMAKSSIVTTRSR